MFNNKEEFISFGEELHSASKALDDALGSFRKDLYVKKLDNVIANAQVTVGELSQSEYLPIIKKLEGNFPVYSKDANLYIGYGFSPLENIPEINAEVIDDTDNMLLVMNKLNPTLLPHAHVVRNYNNLDIHNHQVLKYSIKSPVLRSTELLKMEGYLENMNQLLKDYTLVKKD